MTTESHHELWRERAIFKPYQEVIMERQFLEGEVGSPGPVSYLEKGSQPQLSSKCPPICPLATEIGGQMDQSYP